MTALAGHVTAPSGDDLAPALQAGETYYPGPQATYLAVCPCCGLARWWRAQWFASSQNRNRGYVRHEIDCPPGSGGFPIPADR